MIQQDHLTLPEVLTEIQSFASPVEASPVKSAYNILGDIATLAVAMEKEDSLRVELGLPTIAERGQRDRPLSPFDIKVSKLLAGRREWLMRIADGVAKDDVVAPDDYMFALWASAPPVKVDIKNEAHVDFEKRLATIIQPANNAEPQEPEVQPVQVKPKKTQQTLSQDEALQAKLEQLELKTKGQVIGRLDILADTKVVDGEEVFLSGKELLYITKEKFIGASAEISEHRIGALTQTLKDLKLWSPHLTQSVSDISEGVTSDWQCLGMGVYEGVGVVIVRRIMSKYVDSSKEHQYFAARLGATTEGLLNCDAELSKKNAPRILGYLNLGKTKGCFKGLQFEPPEVIDSKVVMVAVPEPVMSPIEQAVKAATRLVPASMRPWIEEQTRKTFSKS